MSLSNLKGSLGGWGYPKSDGWSSNCSEDSDVVVEEVSSKQGNVCLYKHIISLQHLPASPRARPGRSSPPYILSSDFANLSR